MAKWEQNGIVESATVALGGKEYAFSVTGGSKATVGVNYAGDAAGKGFTFACGTAQQGKSFVDSAIKQFDRKEPAAIVNVARHLNELSSTWKTGFVQGTCECANIVSEKDHKLAAKLLTEMGVDRNMAKKFAHPDTYKKMEGRFYNAPKQELELQVSRGRGR